jgi:threonine aldolase
MEPRRDFASDNTAGIHPDVLAAIAAANAGPARAYGDDPWTERASARFREHFGDAARMHVVFGGTGANVLAISSLLRPFEGVVCAEGAHIAVDECGAPERFSGCKLLTVATPDGKLRPEDVGRKLHGLRDQHHVQPRMVSISQTSELGTIYTPLELTALAAFAHDHGLLLHVDGARLSNAAAALDTSLRAITTDCGADVLSFGGTKNGLMGAEAVVFLREDLAPDFRFVRKQGMQLASKMRFLSAQLEALLSNDLWRRNANHANAAARRLAERVSEIPRVRLARPVEANAVFAILPREAIAALQRRYFFFVWDEARSEVRWMTSFDTAEADVEAFAQAVREVVRGER